MLSHGYVQWAWKQNQLTATQKLVLLAIVELADHEGRFFGSRSELFHLTGIHPTGVGRHVTALVGEGLLRTHGLGVRLRISERLTKPSPPPAPTEPWSERRWLRLRMEVLVERGSRCECCGATPADGTRIHVDHIKPKSKFPELALDKENLQVLCHECNVGKGAWDDTDWRGTGGAS